MATGGVTAPRDGGRVAATIVRCGDGGRGAWPGLRAGRRAVPRGSRRRRSSAPAASSRCCAGSSGARASRTWTPPAWPTGSTRPSSPATATTGAASGRWPPSARPSPPPPRSASPCWARAGGRAWCARPGPGPGARASSSAPAWRSPRRRSRCRWRSPATPGGATTGSSPRASRDGCLTSQRASACRSSSPARSGAAWRSRSHGRRAGGGRSSPPAPGRWSTRCPCSPRWSSSRSSSAPSRCATRR